MTVNDIKDMIDGNEHEYRKLIDSLSDGVGVFELIYDNNNNHVDSIIIYANEAYGLYCGISKQQIIGKKASEFLFEIEPGWLERYEELVRTGKPVQFEEYNKLLDRWYEVCANMLQKESQYAVVIRDITKRKKAEENQNRDKKRTEILFEITGRLLASDSPQLIVEELCLKVMEFLDCHAFFNYLVDEEKMKLHLNACAGIPEETAREIVWLEYGVAVCGCVARDGCRIVAENIQQTPDIRTELVKSFGIKAYACHPLMEQNKVIGTLSFGTRSRDTFNADELSLMKAVADQVAVAMNRIINEQKLRKQQQLLLNVEKEKNEALENVLKMKDEFLYTVSHEFKTPLTVINAALQTIDNVYGNQVSDNVKRHLQRIRMNSYRQIRLVNNFLDLARFMAGHIKIKKQNMDIVFLTHAITQSVVPFAKQKDISLNFSSDVDYKEIAIDDEKYERVLLNLLSNAIKFTPHGQSIYVHIACKNRKVIITVKDEGVGIPKKKQELIFERFGQVDTSLTRQAEGTGIGLSLAKSFVTALGGEITLDSEVNKGSTFTVILPLTKLRKNSLTQNNKEQTSSRILQAMEVEFSDIYL